MKLQVLKNRLIWQLAFLIIADCLFFGLVNPNKVNSLFLVVGFILLGLNLYAFVQVIAAFLIKIGFKVKNRRRLAFFIAILVCLLLALQSIGQLSARDVAIIIPLAVLFYIYLAYIRPRAMT